MRIKNLTRIFTAAIMGVGAILASPQAEAKPPQPGTRQYELLHPYGAYIKRQYNSKGQNCCDPADGRAIEQLRINAEGHYEVWISKNDFDNLPPGWVDKFVVVNDANVLRGSDKDAGRPPFPMVWWNDNEVRCMLPPPLT